jgi:hypothetical protein
VPDAGIGDGDCSCWRQVLSMLDCFCQDMIINRCSLGNPCIDITGFCCFLGENLCGILFQIYLWEPCVALIGILFQIDLWETSIDLTDTFFKFIFGKTLY